MSFEIINSLILFVIGFYILIKGAQILIRGSVSIAKIFGVSAWFTGAVIVSAGTSIPELSINLASVFDGTDVGLAAVLGSNIFNILVVLGLGAIFYPIAMRQNWVRIDFPVGIFVTLLTGFFLFLPVFGDTSFFGITRVEGALLFAALLVWFWTIFRRKIEEEEETDFGVVTFFVAIAMLIAGIIGVFLGGRWVVDGASTIAILLGVTPAIVGLSIVALGTSLPELVVSLVALRQGSVSIAVGNVIGSSVFNLLGVLGLTAIVGPIAILGVGYVDMTLVLFAMVLLYVFMFVGRRYTLARFEGIVFILLYITYITFLFLR